ncbi:MAG: hypothetical protein B7Z73_14525, partial [Planctomycetia bacterium 21-64-5]
MRVRRIHCHARHDGGDHRICPKHEPHCARDRRDRPARRLHRLVGFRRSTGGERLRELGGVAAAADRAARCQGGCH